MNGHRDSGSRPGVLAALLIAASWLPQLAAAQTCPTFASRSEGLPTSVEWRTRPALADVNGDGRLDVAGNPRKGSNPGVWVSHEDGGWKNSSRGLITPGFTCGVGTAFGDVNGDGHVDLGVSDHCHGLFVYLGDGQGNWRIGKLPLRGGTTNWEDLAFGDLNGDGNDDIVAVGAMSGGMVALAGDGKGGFKKLDAGLPRRGYGNNVELGDLNGDGYDDIVAAYSALARRGRRLHALWLSTGPGQYESVALPLPDDRAYYGVSLGDVNADGHLDLAMAPHMRDDWEPVHVLLGDGTGRNWKPANEGLPERGTDVFYGIDLVDVNGDGLDDLVGTRHREAGVRLWVAKADGSWSECSDTGLPEGRTGQVGWGVAVGDVDGDGRPDITWAHGRNGAGGIETWLQQGGAPAGVSAEQIDAD